MSKNFRHCKKSQPLNAELASHDVSRESESTLKAAILRRNRQEKLASYGNADIQTVRLGQGEHNYASRLRPTHARYFSDAAPTP